MMLTWRSNELNKGKYLEQFQASYTVTVSSKHIIVFLYQVLDNKEGTALKNWCFGTVVLEKTLESPLESKEIKPVNLKGNQPWILFGRTDAEAEAPILWLPDANSQLTGKDPDARKDWQ